MAVLYLVGCWGPTKLKQNRKKGRNMLVLSRDRYRWTVMFCRALIVLSTYLGFFSHSTYELFTNQVTHCWWSQSFIFEFHRTTADQRKVWSKKKNCLPFFLSSSRVTIAVAFSNQQLRDSRGYDDQIPVYTLAFPLKECPTTQQQQQHQRKQQKTIHWRI